MIHEWPGLKLDWFQWFGEIRLSLEIKNLNISLKISLSEILPQIGNRKNGTIIFNILLVNFFVNRNNVFYFPFRRKDASKKSLSKNYFNWFIN